MKIKIILTNDNGKIYEGEIALSEGKNKPVDIKSKPTKNEKLWYKPGSRTEKIVRLIDEGFFDTNKTINDLLDEFKSSDYHYKPSDLTDSLRRIVRKRLLKKTKTLPDGMKSKQWTYKV